MEYALLREKLKGEHIDLLVLILIVMEYALLQLENESDIFANALS